jgi:uncharacterized RDD family membrane protein YckC
VISPYDTSSVHTADNVSIGFPVARLGTRILAQVIDNLVALVIAGVLLAIYGAIFIGDNAPSLLNISGATLVFLGAYIGYFVLFEALTGGRTPGKRAIGLRVIRVEGGSVNLTAIVLRNLLRPVDLTAGIGAVVMFFHPLSRRIGDLAAGTLVVRERSALTLAQATAPAAVILKTPDPGPAIDGIANLGDLELNAIGALLSRCGLSPLQRERLAATMAVRLHERLRLDQSAPERMWPPELFLERLYLQLQQRLGRT